MPQEAVKESISLHEEYVRVEEAKIRESIDCWRDIALLKR
jgi:hypothetical protein